MSVAAQHSRSACRALSYLTYCHPRPNVLANKIGEGPMTKKFHRRHFMVTAAATVAASGLHTTQLWGKTIKHKPLDPVNPDILYGTTSSIWGGAGVGGKKTRETPWAIKRVAELGLQGIEFYGDGIEQYRPNPKELEKLMDAAGITFIGASNGEKGQSPNFIDV